MSAYPATAKGVSYHAAYFFPCLTRNCISSSLVKCHISSLVTPIANHSLAILICPAKVGRRMVTRRWNDFLKKEGATPSMALKAQCQEVPLHLPFLFA